MSDLIIGGKMPTDEEWERVSFSAVVDKPFVITSEQFDRAWRALREGEQMNQVDENRGGVATAELRCVKCGHWNLASTGYYCVEHLGADGAAKLCGCKCEFPNQPNAAFAALVDALKEILLSGVEFDGHKTYVVMQVDREAIKDARAVLDLAEKEKK